jgi:hypothetical protein
MKRTLALGLAAVTLASAVTGTALAQRPLGDRDRDGVPNAVDRHDNRWDPAWGPAVNAPRHWNNRHNWNQHVGACRTRYPTYDPHRDMYKMKKRWVRCNVY